MLRDRLLKQVVIAGITPFQFIAESPVAAVVLCMLRVISPLRPDFPPAPGNTGGRTESGFQPKRNCVAGPHTRPWHGPIPHRVCNFAARHEPMPLQTGIGNVLASANNRLCGEASHCSSGRRRNVRSSRRAKRRACVRSPNNFRASAVRPAAARPAICPSTNANSTPPMPVGSPAQKTPRTDVSLKVVDLHITVRSILQPSNGCSSTFGTR